MCVCVSSQLGALQPLPKMTINYCMDCVVGWVEHQQRFRRQILEPIAVF